jgi:hypothetical protein
MADEAKTPPAASAADLKALSGQVAALQRQVDKLVQADHGGELKAHAKRLAALEGGGEPDAAYPWRHRDTGKCARIVDQGNETVFQVEGGKTATLPTHEFNSLYEDATAA